MMTRFLTALMKEFKHVAHRRASLVGIALALSLSTFSGCKKNKSDNDLVIVKSIGEGQRLAAGERSLLGTTKSAVWVDARTKADYDAGHIPGAISLPFERVSQDYYIIEDKPIVIVYGAEYDDNRAKAMSKRLFELLKDHDIRTLDGGVRTWTAAGNELEVTKGNG